MSAKLLALQSLARPNEAPALTWTVTAPTQGVAIVDVFVGDRTAPAPLHWRAGDWTKPPLDLRLSETGALEGIQIVFQDEAVSPGQAVAVLTQPDAGTPVFDVREWPADRYVDNHVAVTTSRLDTGELYAVIDDAVPVRTVAVTTELWLGFSAANQLVAIAIGPLAAGEWDAIGTFGIS